MMAGITEQWPQTREKEALSSSPGEGGFCSSVTKHDRIRKPTTELFCWEDYRSKSYVSKNVSWVRVPEMLGSKIIFP
jgi:hypothetical protein